MSDVNNISNQVAFADADFGSASNVVESQLTNITQPLQHIVTPKKLSLEHFGLPEGVNVLRFYALVPQGA